MCGGGGEGLVVGQAGSGSRRRKKVGGRGIRKLRGEEGREEGSTEESLYRVSTQHP